MKRLPIIWIITCLAISTGLVPYKFPTKFNDKNGGNSILVSHAECTCCADFQILKGNVKIPEHLKDQLKNSVYEINVIRKTSPFEKVNDGNFVMLLYNNEFVLNGQIVGIDNQCGSSIPIFKINNWSPTHYHPILWTFDTFFFYFYFILVGLLLIISLYLTIKRRSK